MRYEDSDHKLRHARKLFEDAIDNAAPVHEEAHRASRFYHNTDGEGQWDDADLAYLKENNRFALTFNIVKTKIDTFLGMYADAQRVPKVASATGDPFLAKCLNDVVEQFMSDAHYESVRSQQLKTGTIQGECSVEVEFMPSKDGPKWIKLGLHRYLPYEVNWDIDSIESDRRDARHNFLHRWLDKDEFIDDYPDYKDEWNTLSTTGQDAYSSIWGGDDSSESGPVNTLGDYSDYQVDRLSRYYFDTKKGKVRVIRYQYKTKHEKHYATDLETGEKTEITKKQSERIKTAQARGFPVEHSMELEDGIGVCDFIGTTLLAEYDEAGPFEGFSVTPYIFEVDEESGNAYGPIRNYFHPQMELNKSKSVQLEYMAQMAAPGTTAEEDQIPDLKKYEAERRRPGGTAIVAKDALITKRVMEREATPPSQAVSERAADALRLLDEVSGLPSQVNLTAAEHAQPGVVHAIKYHKSRQTVSDPFSHYETSQKNIVQKVVEGIVSTMPDDQILEILGGRDDITIQGDMIIQIGEGPPGPDGQPTKVAANQANIRDLRAMKWKLDMEYTSENSTLRMLELDLFIQIAGIGVPMNPEVLIEAATGSRTTQERLKQFVEKTSQQQQQGAETERKDLQEQTMGYIKAEFAKIAESVRHNQATEQIQMTDIEIDAQLKQVSLYEKADNNEKAQLVALMKVMIDAKKAKNENTGGMNG